MHQQRIAARVHRRTVATAIASGEMHIVVVANVANDFAAEQTAATFVANADLLEELRDAPRFQVYRCGWCRWFGIRSHMFVFKCMIGDHVAFEGIDVDDDNDDNDDNDDDDGNHDVDGEGCITERYSVRSVGRIGFFVSFVCNHVERAQ